MTLGEVAVEQLNNGVFRKNPEYLNDGAKGLPVVWVEDLFKGLEISVEECRRLEPTLSEKLKYGLRNGDLLFCRSSLKLDGIGHCSLYTGGDFQSLFECHIIRISPNQNLIFPAFLNYFLRTERARSLIKSRAKTSTMTTIDQKGLCSIPICFPSVPEQRRIAATLDQAETLRTQRRAALAQLDSLTQSIFLEMFGDPLLNPKGLPVVPFGKVGTLDRGISKHRPRNASELLGGIYPLVQTGEVSNCDGYIRSYTRTYSAIGLQQSKMWPEGTLCITIAANIAKTGILKFDACFPDSVVGFRADDPATVEYVRVWLSFLQKALEDSAPESAQKNINLAILRSLKIPLPPITLQRAFLANIQSVEALKATHRAAQDEIDALFASLQHLAFIGKV
jgi:type I restriction enzyme, S subunit